MPQIVGSLSTCTEAGCQPFWVRVLGEDRFELTTRAVWGPLYLPCSVASVPLTEVVHDHIPPPSTPEASLAESRLTSKE